MTKRARAAWAPAVGAQNGAARPSPRANRREVAHHEGRSGGSAGRKGVVPARALADGDGGHGRREVHEEPERGDGEIGAGRGGRADRVEGVRGDGTRLWLGARSGMRRCTATAKVRRARSISLARTRARRCAHLRLSSPSPSDTSGVRPLPCRGHFDVADSGFTPGHAIHSGICF